MWTDIKQRLLKFDSVRGVIFLALGLGVGFTAYYAEQHVILVASVGVGVYLVIEGLRKISYNPIKLDIALDLGKAEYWAKSELGFDPTGVIQPIGTVDMPKKP